MCNEQCSATISGWILEFVSSFFWVSVFPFLLPYRMLCGLAIFATLLPNNETLLLNTLLCGRRTYVKSFCFHIKAHTYTLIHRFLYMGWYSFVPSCDEKKVLHFACSCSKSNVNNLIDKRITTIKTNTKIKQ